MIDAVKGKNVRFRRLATGDEVKASLQCPLC